MGKRKRLHRQAVIAGKEPPFRASSDKPELVRLKPSTLSGRMVDLKERIRKLKEDS